MTEHEAVEALQTWPTFKLDLADLHFAADCVDSFSVKLAARGQRGQILALFLLATSLALFQSVSFIPSPSPLPAGRSRWLFLLEPGLPQASSC